MRQVVIAAAARTPIGSFGGSLAPVPASQLGRVVIAEVIRRGGIAAEQVDEVIMGQILQAGCGQNPARQAAIGAGIPEYVPSYTVNKLCGSGLKSIALGALAIAAGEADTIVAGGMESMSRAPYLLEKARSGYRLGNGVLEDTLLKDALTDAFHGIHMGTTAENIADRYRISREEADAFSLQSQQKAAKALEEGIFRREIVPVPHAGKRGETVLVAEDEYPRRDTTMETLAGLRPAFREEGVVTAGNSSGINDGAAAVLLMGRGAAQRAGFRPLARVLGWGTAGVDPQVMGMGPVEAIRRALNKSGLTLEDVDLVELNEAFAVQSLAVIRELRLDSRKVNVNGGAIALGHPVGASGARVLVTLLHEMERSGQRRGLAALCIGGGQGIAMVVERDV
ncbi:acetyl-CoA C-acetyltransferase [Geobacter sp. SVR]|uniref:acetyl-CoA C-acetyltransferase n=1 Tax=Geobacter sp. SVR TaxID=2495594 RepID=UPI00143EFAD3|nr:acetyl-CoA C-acetyltransferase [Geobacter sp. SVR]BCS55782.1 acetyl-CoA acetyltransferase [Geobacter sp. SVR]GCF83786.1 acetyl-CoA acetyltransferase [Geobacter sp. SVR]